MLGSAPEGGSCASFVAPSLQDHTACCYPLLGLLLSTVCREVCKAAYQKIQDLRAELDVQWAAYKEQNALFRVQLQVGDWQPTLGVFGSCKQEAQQLSRLCCCGCVPAAAGWFGFVGSPDRHRVGLHAVQPVRNAGGPDAAAGGAPMLCRIHPHPPAMCCLARRRTRSGGRRST